MSGRRHTIFTGLTLLDKTHNKFFYLSKTKIKFKILEDIEIQKYLTLNEWKNKTGSYAIIKCLLYCLCASSALSKDILLTNFWGVSLSIGVSSTLGSNTLKGTSSFLRISFLANDEEDKIILLISGIP